MVEKKLLTAHELAKMLDLSVDTIWRYTRENRIPHIEVGPRQYRYIQADVLQALQKRQPAGQVQERQARYAIPPKLTYEDYARIPNEPGYTLQLIDGLIVRDPAPTFLHQRISRRLEFILLVYFEETDPQGEIFNAPIDLSLDQHNIVQPDLLYLPGSRPALRNPLDSLPELIVEISSPSTASTDRVKKMAGYQKAGIPHYWIVDPDDGFVECFALQDSRYVLLVSINEGTFSHPSFPGLSFEMTELFA